MIIVYGGSFNPPTIAHFQIITHLMNKYAPDRLILVPVGDRYPKENLVPFSHRKAMLELITQEIKQVIISDIENQSAFKGTIELLEAVNEKYNDLVFFVLGADNILHFDQWIRFDELIKKYRFIVFPRNGQEVHKFITEHPILSKFADHFYIEEDFQSIPVSSSQYRELEDDSVVLPEVNEYIYRHQLYSRGVNNE